MPCIYFSTVTCPPVYQHSCHNQTLFTKRPIHSINTTWSSTRYSMSPVILRAVLCAIIFLYNLLQVPPSYPYRVLHINKMLICRQMFAPNLPLSFSISLQWLCHIAVQLQLIPAAHMTKNTRTGGLMFRPCDSAVLRAQQEQNICYGSIYMIAFINIHFTSFSHS